MLAGQVASQPTLDYLESSKIVKDTVSKTDKKLGVEEWHTPLILTLEAEAGRWF